MQIDIIHDLLPLANLIPLVFWGAIGFYLVLLSTLVPKVRTYIVKFFSPVAPSTQSHIKSLDAVRGIAALWIAIYHCYDWLPPYFDAAAGALPFIRIGWKSVPIFVILSGFLIYRSIRHFQTAEELRYYIKRRLLRIYPLYIVSVFTYFFLAKTNPRPSLLLQRILPEIFMLPVFSYPARIYPPYWSLYVEEIFYISLPLWVVATRKRPLINAFLGLFIFSMIGNMVPDQLAIMKYFFVGIIAAEIMEIRFVKNLHPAGSILLLMIGTLLLKIESDRGDVLGQMIVAGGKIFGIPLSFDLSFNGYIHYYTLTLGIGMGLIFLALIKSHFLGIIFGSFPFRFLGTISYSIFIWHGFITLHHTNLYFDAMLSKVSDQEVAFPQLMGGLTSGSNLFLLFGIYVPAILFYSAISYLLIERPFLRKKTKIFTVGSLNS